MKLAEALLLRTDIDKAIDELKERIANNSVVQEGTKPTEDPAKLLEELNKKLQEYEKLVNNINMTNLKTKTKSGLTILEAIAKRDKFAKLHTILNGISTSANSRITNRYRNTEILNVTTIDISATQKKLDKLAKQRREIEAEIQLANWANELITS